MRKAKSFVAILALFSILVTATIIPVSADNSIELYENECITFEGVLKKEKYEYNGNDSYAFLLELDEKANCDTYYYDEDDDMYINRGKISIGSVQINELDNAESYVGERVTITGKVMYGHTIHHLVDIVLVESYINSDADDYKTRFIEELLDEEDYWYSGGGYNAGYPSLIEFVDLDFDGKLELVMQSGGGTMRNCDAEVYYFDGEDVIKADCNDSSERSGFQNTINGYYDPLKDEYIWIGSSYCRDGGMSGWTGNFEFKYSNYNYSSSYYSAMTTVDKEYNAGDLTYTYYDSSKGYGDNSGNKISKEEYEKINSDKKANLLDIELKKLSIECVDWEDYDYDEKYEALEESYDAFDYKKVDLQLYSPSGFKLFRDNNKFYHNNYLSDNGKLLPEGSLGFKQSECGFLNKADHSIIDKRTVDRLYSLCKSHGQQSLIQRKMKEKWDGACYGIAATMGLFYNNSLTAKDIDSNNAYNFYSMEFPYQNTKLSDAIEFYYLSQFLKDYGLSSKKCVSGIKNILVNTEYIHEWYSYIMNDYYSFLIDDVKKYGTMLLGLFYNDSNDKKHGHAILTCGIDRLEDGTYDIWIYDENCINHFDHLYLKNNNGKYDVSFKHNGKDGSVKYSASDIVEMFHLPLSKELGDIFPKINDDTENNTDRDELTTILFNSNNKFFMHNSKRENVVSYNGDKIKSDCIIKSHRFIVNETVNNSEAICELSLDKQNELLYESNSTSTDITILNNDDYTSIKGNGINSIDIDDLNTMKIKGNKYSFNVSVNRIINGENQVITISGDANDDISMFVDENDDIHLDSEKNVKDVEIQICKQNGDLSGFKTSNSESIKVSNSGNCISDDLKLLEETYISENNTTPKTNTDPDVSKSKQNDVNTNKRKTNPFKAIVELKYIKIRKIKNKAQRIKPIIIYNNQGKISYKLIKNGISKKIRNLVKINSKGVITIKKWKKAKKGTYKIKVKITAKGNSKYKSKTITKMLKVKIK